VIGEAAAEAASNSSSSSSLGERVMWSSAQCAHMLLEGLVADLEGLTTAVHKPVYMNFTDYKKHMLDRGLKEMPHSACFGADYYFVENERNHAKCITAKTLGGGGTKSNQRKGHFEVAWRTTHADTAGYNCFIASISAFLNRRQLADW
jgi:hypothetical protein